MKEIMVTNWNHRVMNRETVDPSLTDLLLAAVATRVVRQLAPAELNMMPAIIAATTAAEAKPRKHKEEPLAFGDPGTLSLVSVAVVEALKATLPSLVASIAKTVGEIGAAEFKSRIDKLLSRKDANVPPSRLSKVQLIMIYREAERAVVNHGMDKQTADSVAKELVGSLTLAL